MIVSERINGVNYALDSVEAFRISITDLPGSEKWGVAVLHSEGDAIYLKRQDLRDAISLFERLLAEAGPAEPIDLTGVTFLQERTTPYEWVRKSPDEDLWKANGEKWRSHEYVRNHYGPLRYFKKITTVVEVNPND